MENHKLKKIDIRFQEVLARGEKVLVSGVPVGYPSLDETIKLVDIYLKGGIDVVEFSMPAENPYIDTKVIADSNVKALELESNLDRYFSVIRSIRAKYPDEPFYMMAYADLIERYGIDNFVTQLKESEIDGLELPDKDEMVPYFAEELEKKLKENGVYRIYFLQHPFNANYVNQIKEETAGFVILQSIANQQGKRPFVDPANQQIIDQLKAIINTPVVLGYGIKTAEDVRKAVSFGADGILVGTAMIEHINTGNYDAFLSYIHGLKQATIHAQ